VAEKELNLFQFAARFVAQTSTRPPQIVRCQFGNAQFPRLILNRVPHDFLRYFTAPRASVSADAAKNSSVRDPRCRRPKVKRPFDPIGHGYGPDVSTLADEINDGPMFVATLDVIQAQLDQLAPP